MAFENLNSLNKNKKTDKEAERVEVVESRRNFIKKGVFALGGLLLTSNLLAKDKDQPELKKKTGEAKPAPEKRTKEQKIVHHIEKCSQIIKNEQYEEILKNPYLVSALYYSDEAIKKMARPEQNANEKIISSIYPLITKKFRENYMTMLQHMFENSGGSSFSEYNKEKKPLDNMSFGKSLGENHPNAIDLFIKEGSFIYSSCDGLVVLAENGWKKDAEISTSSRSGGNTVIVFNPKNKSFYRYAHMEKSVAVVGTRIPSGLKLGIVGNTGINASKPGHGDHLHFEINKYDPDLGITVATNVFALQKQLSNL